MIFWISDDSDAPAKRSYHIALRNSFLRVIRSLCMNVRFKGKQKLLDRRFVKNSYEVDGCN